jgi:hypothetical protein
MQPNALLIRQNFICAESGCYTFTDEEANKNVEDSMETVTWVIKVIWVDLS